MSEAGATSALVPAISRQALRIVLFGMPNAGKSSLLGALAQAAQTQEHVLKGHLTDVSHGLAVLQHRLYEEAPRETLEEVVPYPVAFDSFTSAGSGGADRHLEACFVDCDGRVANDLIARCGSFASDSGAGALARHILECDALLLVVDAAAPTPRIESDFAEFGRFLQLLEEHRGRHSAVGGWPVFLVLAKCDLLAESTDTATTWLERIGERKRDVNRRFQAFWTRRSAGKPLTFGSLDLHLWATAVKHPGLAGSPPRPRDPFGVAELFRQCLDSARAFRRRQHRSGRRLFWTVAGTLGIMALMLGFAANRLRDRFEAKSTALQLKIANYRAADRDTPALRFREPLQRKISELNELRDDPNFSALPETERTYVQNRLQELEDYRAYKDKLEHVRIADLHSRANVQRLQSRLTTGDLDIPMLHHAEWDQTGAALLRAELVRDLDAFHAGESKADAWYRRSIQEGESLLTFAGDKPSDASSWTQWIKQASALGSKAFPHTANEPLPGSNSLTYALVLRLDDITAAQRDWKSVEQRLDRMGDLIAALGLAGKLPDGDRQPLDIPSDFTLAQATAFQQRLVQLYPNLQKELPGIELPDAVADDLQRKARIAYDHLVDAGRKTVLDHFQQAKAHGHGTADRWQHVLTWLDAPSDLQNWRVLATLLARIQDRNAVDPVTTLADFLRHDRFEIDVERVTLEVPLERKLKPAGQYVIYYANAGALPVAALTFRLVESEGQQLPQRRATAYTFVRERGTPFVYRPGDTLYAALRVKKEGDGDWLLTWARSRSEDYQFERLVRPPRLHRQDQENIAGELMEDISVILAPAGGVPKVPDLMPVVVLKKP